jgi:hypothetical protein
MGCSGRPVRSRSSALVIEITSKNRFVTVGATDAHNRVSRRLPT